MRGAEVEDVQALLFELAAQRRLAIGDEGALGDLTGRGGESTAELHASGDSSQLEDLPHVGLRLAERRHPAEPPYGARARVVRGDGQLDVEAIEQLAEMADAGVDVGRRVERVARPGARAPSPA